MSEPSAPHPIIIPSPIPTPLTPEPKERELNGIHSSPSFDYHEERRLYLKDEIWLSHNLPRLPPATLSDSTTVAFVSSEGSSTPKANLASPKRSSGHSVTSDPASKEEEAEVGGGIGIKENLRNGGAGMSSTSSSSAGGDDIAVRSERLRSDLSSDMLSSSLPEGAEIDRTSTLIHREELDVQERLDLAAEKQERLISEMRNDLGAKDSERSGIVDPAEADTSVPPFVDNQQHGIVDELESLYASFARCLDLRDKYLELSHQRLGDNPRDHDGAFHGFYPRSLADVYGLKPDANVATCEDTGVIASFGEEVKHLEAWKIYPPPPPPNWHWKQAADGVKPNFAAAAGDTNSTSRPANGSEAAGIFRYEDCPIPGESSERRDFTLNDEGVFEVWDLLGMTSDRKGKTPITRIPSLKEYFTDLDYLLGVCSDGPAKSFAFRRLKYLASKWSLFCLLNEYQELADMKVCQTELSHMDLTRDP